MTDARVAVVTGASSGIGRAIAVALGGLGWTVAVGARRADVLEETAAMVLDAGGAAIAHPLDVCDSASIDAFLDAVGPVDVLVNNAGVSFPGLVHELDDDTHRRIIDTNLTGPILVTKRVVGAWRAEKRPGDVLFVTSDTAMNPRPYMATYGVAKVALESFARILALECEDCAIRASVVRVGPTVTAFGDSWDPALFADIFPAWTRFGIQRHFNTMQPEDVARAVVTAVTAPAHMWVPVIEVQPLPPVT